MLGNYFPVSVELLSKPEFFKKQIQKNLSENP